MFLLAWIYFPQSCCLSSPRAPIFLELHKCRFDLGVFPEKEQYTEEQFNEVEDLPSTQSASLTFSERTWAERDEDTQLCELCMRLLIPPTFCPRCRRCRTATPPHTNPPLYTGRLVDSGAALLRYLDEAPGHGTEERHAVLSARHVRSLLVALWWRTLQGALGGDWVKQPARSGALTAR